MRGFAKKLAIVFIAAAAKLEGLLRPSVRPGPGAVESVLVLEYVLYLGNCIHSTPLFEAIKHSRPEVTVTVATSGIGADVVRHSPFIDHLIITPNPLKDFWGAVRSLRKQLRERSLKPDCCLTGAADMRSKVALFAALASGWRGGLTLLPALYARPLEYDKSRSVIANNMRLAELIGINAGQPPEPKLFYSKQDAAVARELVEAARSNGKPVLTVIARGSGGLPTAWHDDRWAATIRYAHRELGYNILYVGTAQDASSIEKLKVEADGIGTSLAGATTVNQLAAVIALSDMAISIDTGGFHVTRTVGTPVVLLGLAWEKPLIWLPEGRSHIRILRGPELEKAPPGYRLDEITVEWATRELADMMRLFPADAQAREARLRAGLSEIDHFRRSSPEAKFAPFG